MFDAEATAARVARKGSKAYAAALAAASASRDAAEAFAAAQAAVRATAPKERMSIGEVHACATEFAAGHTENLSEIKEAMFRCRNEGGTDAAIKRAGRKAAKAAAESSKAFDEIYTLANGLAEEITRGERLRRNACQVIFDKAWAAHENGQDATKSRPRPQRPGVADWKLRTKSGKDW